MSDSKGIDKLLEAMSEKENFKEMIGLGHELINSKKMERNEDFKTGISDRLYSFILIVVCLGAVIFLSYTKILDGVSTGTLIGAIIGYALGKAKQEE